MECRFYVGQKVLCLRDDWGLKTIFIKEGLLSESGMNFPNCGEVYTIREMRANERGVGLLFVEITNPDRQYKNFFGEVSFLHKHFRPLTDISSLEALLTALPAPGLLNEELHEIVRDSVQRQKEGV